MITPTHYDDGHLLDGGLRITEERLGLCSSELSARKFMLIGVMYSAPLGLIPLCIFPIDRILSSNRLLQITALLLISSAALGVLSAPIERGAAWTSATFERRRYHYRTDSDARTTVDAIAFSKAAFAWRLLFAMIVSIGWAIPHIVLSMNGINQWWNPPIGLLGLYGVLFISWFFAPTHAIRWRDDLWIYYSVLGKLRVPLDKSTFFFDRNYGCFEECSVNRRWLRVVLIGSICQLGPEETTRNDGGNRKRTRFIDWIERKGSGLNGTADSAL